MLKKKRILFLIFLGPSVVAVVKVKKVDVDKVKVIVILGINQIQVEIVVEKVMVEEENVQQFKLNVYSVRNSTVFRSVIAGWMPQLTSGSFLDFVKQMVYVPTV